MSKKRAASANPNIIRRAVEDDNGGRYFLIGTKAKSVWISLEELAHDEMRAMAKIGGTGVRAITTKSKNIVKEAVERQTEFDPALVATRPGWVRYDIYVHANGDVQRPVDVDIEVIVAFQPDPGWSRNSTMQKWQEGLNRLIPCNQLAAGLLCYAFASLLLSKAPPHVINPALQLVGPPESGKSTLATMVMSIFGGDPSSEIGIGRTWDMSPKAQEEVRRMSCDAVLFLDEENVQDEKVRDNYLAIFLNSSSGGRARPGDTDRKPPLRSALLSTANVSSRQRQTRGHGEVGKAAATRLVSLVFDGPLLAETPSGFSSTRDVVRALSRHSAECYGAASRAFVEKIIEACTGGEKGFRTEIYELMELFDTKAPTAEHGSDRIRTTFALMFAAGRLAERWNIMPSACASVKDSVVALYRLAEANTDPSGPDHALKMIQDVIAKHRNELSQVALGHIRKRAVSPGRLGCIVHNGATSAYYLRPKRLRELLGANAGELIKRLRKAGLLQAEPQKLTVKPPVVTGLTERVHKIVLPD